MSRNGKIVTALLLLLAIVALASQCGRNGGDADQLSSETDQGVHP